MTRLFIRFYIGVLSVLFAAWYIHGAVTRSYVRMERSRVIESAHRGYLRVLADELAPESDRKAALVGLQEKFDYPIGIVKFEELPAEPQSKISEGADTVYFEAAGGFVFAPIGDKSDVVMIGPFPGPGVSHIEKSLAGGTRLAVAEIAENPEQRQSVLSALRQRFDFPVDVVSRNDLSNREQQALSEGRDVVFYIEDNEPNEGQPFVITPLPNGTEFVRFGPFPNFDSVDQKANASTLALVLLPAALAIALLLRPVARQLRHVEHAAKAIAAGDLSTRVDERRVPSAKALAQSFNHMADRTEALVQTQRELLQAVSHELRTPLSRMRFAIDLIGTAQDDSERKKRLAALDMATEELDHLVGELLSYVRLATAETRPSREDLSLPQILGTIVPNHASLYPSVEFEVSEAVERRPSTIHADRGGLQRVLGNLLNNAGRFARSHVTVDAKTSKGVVTIDVDDDGSGIPEAAWNRVFEPFTRLEGQSSSPGVGLGLALVKRIVTQHGGSVRVLNSPSGGCRIRTTWPGGSDAEHDAQGGRVSGSQTLDATTPT